MLATEASVRERLAVEVAASCSCLVVDWDWLRELLPTRLL